MNKTSFVLLRIEVYVFGSGEQPWLVINVQPRLPSLNLDRFDRMY